MRKMTCGKARRTRGRGNGVSQASELKTLDELGIVAIHVGKTEHSQLLPNGNEIADLGTFVRSDGSVGSAGTVPLHQFEATRTYGREWGIAV